MFYGFDLFNFKLGASVGSGCLISPHLFLQPQYVSFGTRTTSVKEQGVIWNTRKAGDDELYMARRRFTYVEKIDALNISLRIVTIRSSYFRCSGIFWEDLTHGERFDDSGPGTSRIHHSLLHYSSTTIPAISRLWKWGQAVPLSCNPRRMLHIPDAA